MYYPVWFHRHRADGDCHRTTPRYRWGNRRRALTIVGTVLANLALLSACASYRSAPLPAAPDALAPPAATTLSIGSESIDRPWLRARSVDLEAPLELEAIALIALERNPELAAMRARAGVADAQLFDARLIPDPGLSLSAEFVVSGPASTAAGTFAGQLLQDLNALRTRRTRIAVAKAAQQQVRLDLAWAEWQTTGAARLEAVRLSHLQRIVALTDANSASADDLLARSLRAAGRGDISPDQLTAARLASLDALDRAQQARLALIKSQTELRRLTGLPPDWPLRIADQRVPPPPPAKTALFDIARAQRLDLCALQAGYLSQEATLRLAILNQFPTLNFGVSVSRDNSDNGFLGPLVDFTLPLWNRNRGNISIEQATRAALQAEYANRVFQTRAELTAAAENLQELYRQRSKIAPQIPELKKFIAATQRAARRGDIPEATAIGAEQSLRDKLILLAGIEQNIAEQSIALELLTGAPRTSWNL